MTPEPLSPLSDERLKWYRKHLAATLIRDTGVNVQRNDLESLISEVERSRAAFKLMTSEETDWENGATGVGYMFREIAYSVIDNKPLPTITQPHQGGEEGE